MMGLHDILYMLEIQIDSDEAVAFNDRLLSFIYASHVIHGEGSLWSKGILPIDSYKNLMSYKDKR